MGNFAENLNLGNRFRPPLLSAVTSPRDYRLHCIHHVHGIDNYTALKIVMIKHVHSIYVIGTGGGYLVERWVRGCAAQIGCFFWPLRYTNGPFFYLKIGLDTGRVFAKCIIFDDFPFSLPRAYRLSKSTYGSQFIW